MIDGNHEVNNNYWASVEAALLDMERQEKYDLFVIGYLIPHVGLSEANCPSDSDPETHFKSLVRASVNKDIETLTEKDIATIETILSEI